MTFSKAGSNKRSTLRKTVVGTTSLLFRQTMDHWHEEMIIPIIIKMEVKKLISGGCIPDSVRLSLPFV